MRAMTGKVRNDGKPLRSSGAPPLAGEAQEQRSIVPKASTDKGRWHGVPEGLRRSQVCRALLAGDGRRRSLKTS